MSKRHLALLIVLLFMAASGCASGRVTLEQRYEQGLKPFTPQGIGEAGLAVAWQQDLLSDPLKKGRKDTKAVITDIYLYEKSLLAVASDNLVWSFERQTGSLEWIAKLPQPLKFAPSYSDGRYYCVSGAQLYIIDSRGVVSLGSEFAFSVSKPPLVLDDYLYAPASDGNLHKVDRNRLAEIWAAPARTGSVISGTPIMLESMLVFGTADGQVLAIDRVIGGRRVDLKGLGMIAGEIVTDGQSLYFGSSDFHVCAYSSVGAFIWKAVVPGMMGKPPVLAGDVLYAELVGGGVLSLNKKDGAKLWINQDVASFASWDPSRVFVTAGTKNVRELWVLDAATGKPVSQVATGGLNLMVRNMAGDGLIFLAGADGRVVCLRPQ